MKMLEKLDMPKQGWENLMTPTDRDRVNAAIEALNKIAENQRVLAMILMTDDTLDEHQNEQLREIAR